MSRNENSSKIFLFLFTLAMGKEPELPICPTNFQYLPQNLPMHCRMPANANFAPGQIPTLPPGFPPYFPGLPNSKQLPPLQFQMPGGQGPIMMPGGPNSIPMQGPMGMPGPMEMPGPMGIPAPMSMPLPASVPIAGPQGPPRSKLPVIVMPFYSPDNSNKDPKEERPRWKKHYRRPRPNINNHNPETDTCEDDDDTTDTSSDRSGRDSWWNGRRGNRVGKNRKSRRSHLKKKPKRILTPVLQYVTKDGYVIFEKQISKGEAKDWLEFGKEKVVQKADENKQIIQEGLKDAEEIIEPTDFQEKVIVKPKRLSETEQIEQQPEQAVKVQKASMKKTHRRLKPNSLIKKSA